VFWLKHGMLLPPGTETGRRILMLHRAGAGVARDRDDGSSSRGGEVHWTGIVADEELTPLKHRGRL
jgi:hypothetical protein